MTTRGIAGSSRGDGEQLPTSIVDIPGDLLQDVLLRVRTPACLFRAAATCKLWRRVIAGDGFLHCFRSRHGHGPRLLVGHYSVSAYPYGIAINAEFVPSPPRSAIRLRQRVSLDFLIRPGHRKYSQRELADCRGGLLAFVRDNWFAIVCDPWTRQYRELPPFPWGGQQRPGDVECFYRCIGAFLLDAGGDDDSSSPIPMSSFRLLCACAVKDDYFNYWVESCVFSARDNRWVSSSTHARRESVYMFDLSINHGFVGRAGGSIFWAAGNLMLVLDESTFEFSTFLLPVARQVDSPYNSRSLRVVAGGGAGAVRVVCIVDDDVLEVITASRGHGGSWELTLESCAGLGDLVDTDTAADTAESWRFVDTDTAAGLVLEAFSPPNSTATSSFSLDVETMQLQPVTNRTTLNAQRVFTYELPWPKTI